MDLVVEFYNSLDILNLIIFWGIIVVIILLIIFSSIMISKNKKKINVNNVLLDDELPIKEDTIEEIKDDNKEIIEKQVKDDDKVIVLEDKIEEKEDNIEEEKFVAEEYVKSSVKEDIVIPNKPYQRNVLREMSLSQTSPIGITKPVNKINMNLVKDLHDSLNIDDDIKNELEDIKNIDDRRTEIVSDNDLLVNIEDNNSNEIKSDSEKYLEEVSKKLSEADVIDDVKRTNYELEQEENAIISYKELMEKKDSIKTIDEEEAIISIEELMNHKVNEDSMVKEDTKLYHLTEEEENDSFIRELKQFRSDL